MATMSTDSIMTDRLTQLQSRSIDYSPWQRYRSPTNSLPRSHHKQPTSSSTNCNLHDHAEQSSCHPRPSEKKRLAAIKAAKLVATEQSVQNERIKLLRLHVVTKRQMLEDSLKREVEILEDNFRLKDVLEFDEKEAHEGIKQLLRKYERFRGGMENISSKFAAEMAREREKLEATRVEMKSKVEKLESSLKTVDDQLRSKQSELNSLRNYTDKEKPAKAMKIAELVRKIELLKAENLKEITELQHIVELDREKTDKTQLKALGNARTASVKNAVQKIEPSIEDIAIHNKQLQQEIGIHQAEIRRLEETNKLLRQEVRQMLQDPRTNVRHAMFPELYPSPTTKCTPDIPVREWLPI